MELTFWSIMEWVGGMQRRQTQNTAKFVSLELDGQGIRKT